MSAAVTIGAVEDAARQLARTERGQRAMRDLLIFFENGAISLDAENISACETLIRAVWGPYPGSARDIMRDSLGE